MIFYCGIIIIPMLKYVSVFRIKQMSREDHEQELKKALIRQAEVYHDHIDSLKRLISEEYERKVRQNGQIAEAQQLVEIRSKYSQATAALAAMEKVLSGMYPIYTFPLATLQAH